MSNDSYPAIYTPPVKAKIPVKTVDLAFALISLVLGYLFIKNGLFSMPGAGIFAFVILFVAASLIYVKIKKGRLNIPSLIVAFVILAFSSVFILSDNGYIKRWVLFFECISVLYWYFCMFGKREDTRIDDMFLFKLIKFCACHSAWPHR
jgi:hypothetical protein